MDRQALNVGFWDVEDGAERAPVRDYLCSKVSTKDVEEFCRRYHYTGTGGNMGRRTMVPKPQRPVPGSRLGLCGHEGSNPQSRADGAAMTTIFSPVCGWCLPKHPILEKKP